MSGIQRCLALMLARTGVAEDPEEGRKAVIDTAAELLEVNFAVLDDGIWQHRSDRVARCETEGLGGPDGDRPEVDDASAAHYLLSSYREAMLEHFLIGELMRTAWLTNWRKPLEVYKPQVDAAGVDVVLVRDGVTRPIQLKTSKISGRASSVNVHTTLWQRPRSCVIWTWFDPETLELKEFFWLGEPGRPLPPLNELKVAKHTRGNAQGEKGDRPALRVVEKKWFKRLASVEELFNELFGSLK